MGFAFDVPRVLALVAVLAGCSQLDDPGRMPCETWLVTPVDQRLTVADRLVVDSAESLERIRVVQHRPAGTPRDVLVADVEASLTKDCEVWPPRTRTIGEVLAALYR